MKSVSFEWNFSVKNAIESVVKECKNRICLFDFDGTLVVNDIADAAVAIAAKNSIIPHDCHAFALLDEKVKTHLTTLAKKCDFRFAGELVKAYKKLLKNERKKGLLFAAQVVDCVENLDKTSIKNIVKIALNNPIKSVKLPSFSGEIEWKIGVAPLAPMQKLIENLHENGAKICVISASHKGLVSSAIKVLYPQILPQNIYGVEAKNNFIPNGKTKAEIAKKVAKSGSVLFAAGDTIYDFPMLELAQKSLVLVHKNNQKIVLIAQQKGFLVQQVLL